MLLLTTNVDHEWGGQQPALVIREPGPRCGAPTYQPNGHIHHGPQPQPCKGCRRPFVRGLEHDLRAAATRTLLEGWLLARSALRGLCRAMGGGLNGGWGVLVTGVATGPAQVHVASSMATPAVLLQRREVEAEAMRRLVHQQANKPWRGRAMDTTTRQVMAFDVGDRRRTRAKRLGAKRPRAYRQHATFDTDQDVVYAGVIPAAPHKAMHQLGRHPQHLDRFHPTVRPRVARLGQETVSFSQTRPKHLGAINSCIGHDHLPRLATEHQHSMACTTNLRRIPFPRDASCL